MSTMPLRIALSLFGVMANVLPELCISNPHGHYMVHPGDLRIARGLEKRQSTASTNTFDVLSWSYDGGYYVKSAFPELRPTLSRTRG